MSHLRFDPRVKRLLKRASPVIEVEFVSSKNRCIFHIANLRRASKTATEAPSRPDAHYPAKQTVTTIFALSNISKFGSKQQDTCTKSI